MENIQHRFFRVKYVEVLPEQYPCPPFSENGTFARIMSKHNMCVSGARRKQKSLAIALRECYLDMSFVGHATSRSAPATIRLRSVIVQTLRVPNINERRRIPMRAIRQVVREIADKFEPERVILFGSYAYGNPCAESDVDVLVIMNTSLRTREQAFEIARSVEHHFGLELIVRTPDQLKKRIALGDPFLKEVVEKGKILYERPDPGVD